MTTDFHDPIPEEAPGYSFIPNRRFAQIAKAIGETGSRIDEKGNLVLADGDFSRNHVVFGKAHLWVDGDGNPRWNGMAPSDNQDGVILRGKDQPPPEPDTGGDIVAPVNPNPTIFVNLTGPINTVSSLLSLDENRLLVGGGNADKRTVFSYVYTIDDPFTEAEFTQSLAERFVYRFVGLGGGVVLASTGWNGRIFRSTDRGATWAFSGELRSGRGLVPETRAMIHRGAGVVLAGSNNTGQIWRTNNGGDTWSDTGFFQPGVRNVWDFTVGTGGRVHAACGGSKAAIFYTDDLGATWQAPTTQPDRGLGISAIAAFPDGRLVAGTRERSGRPTVFLSDDGGVIWRARFTLERPAGGRFGGRRTTHLLPLGGGRMLLATGDRDGDIYETIDRGESWVHRVSPGPNCTYIFQMVRHGANVYCTTTGGSRRVYQIIP